MQTTLSDLPTRFSGSGGYAAHPPGFEVLIGRSSLETKACIGRRALGQPRGRPPPYITSITLPFRVVVVFGLCRPSLVLASMSTTSHLSASSTLGEVSHSPCKMLARQEHSIRMAASMDAAEWQVWTME